ncbi:MAG: ATPase domain-containing protein, partial [Candidatus Limnocylindria bacterium]
MSLHSDRAELRRLSTGSARLDAILGGGLPERSLSVIAGPPGVGKTVFALQLLFHFARQNKRAVFFTTLSEPSLKLIRYMQQFAFFDADLLDERVTFIDLGSALLDEGPERALEIMGQHVEQYESEFVVIDSFKAIHDLLPADGALSRRVVYELAVWLAAWGATTVLVGEYGPDDISRLPEFAIADGIIRLASERHELTSFRQIEILKMRGADYLTGLHFFEMSHEGLTFFPRVRAPDYRGDGGIIVARERVTTGLAELDAMFGGGPLRSSTTLVEGGTGTGKTLLGLLFLLAGIERGEPGVHLGLEETPDQLRGLGATLGWDLVQAEASGHLRLSYTSPVELSTDRYLDQARQQVADLGARRVVLDGLSSLALSVPSERRFKELVYASTKHFRGTGATVYMTLELEEALGSGNLSGRAISSLADNVILLRHLELRDRLERAVLVLKARGTGHESGVRHFLIDATGPHIGGPFAEIRGG